MPSLLSQFRFRHGLATSAGTAEHDAQSSDLHGREDEESDQGDGIGSLHAGSRRPRSESMETEAQCEDKRRKRFATSLCTMKGFPDNTLDDFISLNPTDMMISIHADILEMQLQGKKSEAEKFIASEEFKDIMKDRLRACLLSPNLTAYVLGLGDQVFAFAKKNLQSFKIPEAALNDPEMSEKIIFLIKDLLTSQRSNMKQKLANHTTNKSHISILCKSLAPGGGYEITAAHWARIAFLRDSLTGFNIVIEESHARARSPTEANEDSEDGLKSRVWTHADFWEYVDHVLRELRVEARAEAEDTPTARAKHLEIFFTRCLQSDLRIYPGTVSSPPVPAFDKVTVPWQVAIHNGLIW